MVDPEFSNSQYSGLTVTDDSLLFFSDHGNGWHM